MAVKKQNTEVRQQQIINAARILIFKYGSEHLTVKKIAAQVGISEAAIYRHFTSKKSILSFLMDHIEESLLADLAKEVTDGQPITIETIEKTIHNHFSAIDLRKGISFQVIAEIISLGDKSLNKKAYQTISRYIQGLKALLAGAVQSGSVRENLDLEAAATLFFGLIQGLVNIWSLSNSSLKLIDQYTLLWQVYREAIVRR
jgi:TetR/AcrR family transcriptional regulator